MKTVKILMILLFTFSIQAQTLVPIKKGEPAPFDGFVIDKPMEAKFRLINEKFKLSEAKVLKLKDLQIVQKQQVKQYEVYTNRLESGLAREQWVGTFKGIGGFFLGVIITSMAYKTVVLVNK